MADRFLIAPYDKGSGLQSNVKPWLLNEDAFSTLNNSYVWRGRVRKRFGSRWITNDQSGTRLRVLIGTAAGNVFNGFVPVDAMTTIPIVTPAVGQMFSIGTTYFTVNVVTPGVDTLLRSDGLVGVATFDTSPLAGGGAVSLNNVSNLDVYYYPALPVMGLLTMDSAAVNVEPTIGFDTRFAYQYVNNGWERLAIGDSVWQGTDSQLFYGVTWVGDNGATKIFFVTNFDEDDPLGMRYLSGTTWTTYRPLITDAPETTLPPVTNYLFSARVLTVFHNHLIALNTWEGSDITTDNVNFQNRARWSWTDSPLFEYAPGKLGAWRQDIPGRGSGLDASTTESIIGAEFVQDRLIVYFERSTWELVWTGNSVQPFTWQQVNTELGCESTFSVIPFDKMALGIGQTGIHSCNGIGVDRIDQAIPELVIESISNANSGAARVYGIRDYTAEMVYWAYPDVSTNDTRPYPNKILTYNYVNQTWAINDEVLTCFGYFQAKTGVLWDSKVVTWSDDESWDSGGNANVNRFIVIGNQQGWTYILDQGMATNAPSLQITDIAFLGDSISLLIPFHSLKQSSYIYIQNVTGTGTMTSLNGQIFQVLSVSQDQVNISLVGGITGVYSGAGTVSAVSNIDITTKQYNFYFDKSANACINKIDFQVDRIGNEEVGGEIGVQLMTSTSPTNLTAGAITSGAIVGNGTLVTKPYRLYPYEKTADRVIHPFYTSVSGSFIQIKLTMTPQQMLDVNVMRSDFQLHSMTISCTPTNRLQ